MIFLKKKEILMCWFRPSYSPQDQRVVKAPMPSGLSRANGLSRLDGYLGPTGIKLPRPNGLIGPPISFNGSFKLFGNFSARYISRFQQGKHSP